MYPDRMIPEVLTTFGKLGSANRRIFLVRAYWHLASKYKIHELTDYVDYTNVQDAVAMATKVARGEAGGGALSPLHLALIIELQGYHELELVAPQEDKNKVRLARALLTFSMAITSHSVPVCGISAYISLSVVLWHLVHPGADNMLETVCTWLLRELNSRHPHLQ